MKNYNTRPSLGSAVVANGTTPSYCRCGARVGLKHTGWAGAQDPEELEAGGRGARCGLFCPGCLSVSSCALHVLAIAEIIAARGDICTYFLCLMSAFAFWVTCREIPEPICTGITQRFDT